MRPGARALAAAALFAASGCILSVNQTVTPVERTTPVPDKYKSDAAPELVDAGIDGCQRAPSLDQNLYYCAKDEHWFRWALNRWYMAFAWNGNWFPVTKSELPTGLAQITPAPEEVKKSREERLKELEKELEKLDPEKAPQNGH
jgi:hypothetical protein